MIFPFPVGWDMDWFLGYIPPDVVKDVFFYKGRSLEGVQLKTNKQKHPWKNIQGGFLWLGFLFHQPFPKRGFLGPSWLVPKRMYNSLTTSHRWPRASTRQVKRAEQRVRSGTPLGRRQRSLSAGRRKESPFDKMTVEEMCHSWGVDE